MQTHFDYREEAGLWQEQVGSILKSEARNKGLEVRQVAENSGVPKSGVQRVYDGSSMTVWHYYSVALALGFSLEMEWRRA